MAEEVQEKQMEMFKLADFEVVKQLISYTSFPSRIYIYQMPNKATSYSDGTVETSAKLMNDLLAYQREEEWRVESCTHVTEWMFEKRGEDEVVTIKVVSSKGKEYVLSFKDIKEAIVVPDLHSITIIPSDDAIGDILPNMIIRFVGLVQHKFFKCILFGTDDKENEGQRVLSMKLEAMD